MATSIIKNSSASFQTIKQNIREYLEGLNNWEEIKDGLPASNLTLIEDLMAGFAAYIAQRQMLYREETYLQQAKLPTSVYQIANVFGYSINRYTAPSFKIKYNDVPTITLKSGDVLGAFGEYDIVYFGPNKIIEKLDLIDVYVGRYQEAETTVQFDNGSFLVDISPLELTSVDRGNIACFLDDVPQEISRAIEDYIVFNNVADYSLDPFSTRLFVSDIDNSYGIVAAEGSTFKVKYLETTGLIENIKVEDAQLNDEYLAVEVNHEGTIGDTLEKIKRLAPLLYSTLRRMVTEKDHKYLAEAYPLISSASAERDLGTPASFTVEFQGNYESDDFSVVAQGSTYTYTGQSGDTQETVTQAVYDAMVLSDNPIFIQELNTPTTILITSADARNLTFGVVAGDNCVVTETDINLKPACCTVNLFYVLTTVVNDPVYLTSYEKLEFGKYLNGFKMVGLRLVLQPAGVDKYDLAIRLGLTDPDYYDEVKLEVEKIYNQYEFILEKDFDYGTFLVQVANIQIFDADGVLINPVTAVVPDQPLFNITGSKYSYVKFDNVSIILE